MKKNLFLITTLILTFMLVLTMGISAKTLRIASKNYCATLDPAYMNTNHTTMPILNSIYNGLVKYKEGSFEIEPDLAKDWEVSEDGKEITFYLKEGVQFHKGYGELTAEDVKFSIDRIINDDSCPYKVSYDAVKEVKKIDKYTVKLIMNQPMAQLFSSTLTNNAGYIVSKKAVQEMGKEKFSHNPVGTGPYVFNHWVPEGEIVLDKNNNYWEEEAFVENSPEKVKFIPMEDAFARSSAVQSNELDLGEISLDLVDQFKKMKTMNVNVMPDLAYWWVSFTVDKPPMDNIKLRKALRYIIDPEEIIQGAFGGKTKRTNSMLQPSFVGYWEDAPAYDVEDVGKEKVYELLEEAGYPKGEGLELTFLTGKSDARRNSAQVIQAQLAEYGIDLKIDVREMGALIEAAKNGEYHMHIARYTMTASPIYCTQWFKSGQDWNFMQYKSKEYDGYINEATHTLDEDKRDQLLIKAQKEMDKDAIAVWVCHGARAWGYNENVNDPKIRPDSFTVIPWKIQMK